MSNRKTKFTNEQCYHAFNRGVDKRKIFLDQKDYERFLLSMILLNDETDGLMIQWRDYSKLNPKVKPSEFLRLNLRSAGKKPLVEIIAYCLNPNHYHFILKQLAEKGIEKFMQKIGTSYTMYFNQKYKRSGSLFQGTFKSVHIDPDDYLLYLSAYVNKNNFIHGYTKDDSWIYSSWPEYLGKVNQGICNKEIILGQFKNASEYKEFVESNALYLKEKKEAEKYLLE